MGTPEAQPADYGSCRAGRSRTLTVLQNALTTAINRDTIVVRAIQFFFLFLTCPYARRQSRMVIRWPEM
jgi:hypothetical protein